MEQIRLFALDRKLAGKILRAGKFLNTMGRVVLWEALTEAIGSHCQGGAATGRKAMPLERMLCIYFLQQCID